MSRVQKFVCVANIGVPHLSVYGGITGTDGFMLSTGHGELH